MGSRVTGAPLHGGLAAVGCVLLSAGKEALLAPRALFGGWGSATAVGTPLVSGLLGIIRPLRSIQMGQPTLLVG